MKLGIQEYEYEYQEADRYSHASFASVLCPAGRRRAIHGNLVSHANDVDGAHDLPLAWRLAAAFSLDWARMGELGERNIDRISPFVICIDHVDRDMLWRI